MIEAQEGKIYFESGAWPARQAKFVGRTENGPLVTNPDGSGGRYISTQDLYVTRLEADEATIKTRRQQLANVEARALELGAEIEELESKKGQA